MESCPEIVRTAVDYAFEALGRHVLYLCCYERNVDDLENVAEKLRDARQRLQHSVDAARQNVEHIEDDVQHWMEKVNVISEEIQKFREDGNHARAEFSNCRFPNLWSRYKLSRRAKKLSEAIVEIQDAGSFGSISYRMPPTWWTGTSSVQASGSRISLMDEIIESLKNSDFNMVGVFGLGGVGKTTLVTQVAKRVAEDKLFDFVISVEVTQKIEMSKIQKELAEFLGLKIGEESEGIRAIRLRDRLKTEKSVLIVLDDLWEGLDLEKVGIPFGDEHKGCKILLTSRSEEVLSNQMDCQKTFEVDCLSEDEAWSLFKNVAELDGNNVERDILTIATEVAKKCGGLPIAIVTVAKALRRKRVVAHWRDALRQLKSPTSRDIVKMVDSCIEFSYIHLGNHELQSLFLLCAWFGREIEFTDILKYSVGLSLLSDTSTIAESRDRLETLLTTLKASCLLTQQSVRFRDFFTMHDVVRAVGISIAAKCQNQLRFDKLNVWPDQNQLQSCTTINLMECEILCELPNELLCPALTFLLICERDQDLALTIPDNFFKEVCKLKVLGLTGMQFSCLPSSMAHLTNLESLSLDGCILQDIEVIGELKKLKILSLAYSDIRRLPQSFENLTQLQLLDLSSCLQLERIPRNVISKWKKLEELMMGYTSNVQWENERSNAYLTELNHLPMLKTLEIFIDSSMLARGLELENLTRYKISIGKWRWHYKSNVSKMLRIELERSDLYLERWIKFLLKSVQELHLGEFVGVKSVVDELNEDGFPYLKHVYIEDNAEIQYIVNLKECNHSFDVFPDLESLDLYNLFNLEKICDGQLSQASFSKLKVITVTKCYALRNLFSMYTGISLISQLEEIKVVDCNSMTQIFGGDKMEDNNVDFGVLEFNQLKSLTLEDLHKLVGFVGFSSDVKDGLSMPLFSEKVAFFNLETLELSSIHCQKIWQDGPSACSHVQNLTTLDIQRCTHLKYLFSLSVLKCLVKLKSLEISSCCLMEDIIHLEDWRNIPDSGEIWFPSLTKMTLEDLDSLRSIWSEHVPPIAYPKLQTITIYRCHKLETIIPTYMLGRLKSLEALHVRECSSLDEVFSMNADGNLERMEMTNLKELTLRDLPELKHIWSEYPKGNSCFQSLQMIEVWECHSLKNIFPPSIAQSLAKLREMSIKFNDALKEIVSKDESVKEAAQFVFPEMTEMKIVDMPELNWFYGGIHTLEFPKLKDLKISKCDNLELFAMQMLGPSELEKTNVVNQKELGIQKPLFFIEKDLPALETLSLDSEQFEKMQNMAKFSMNHFRMLKELKYGQSLAKYGQTLSLVDFYSEQAFFPYFLLQRIPTLEKLRVSSSSFREVFPRVNLHSQAKDDRTACHLKVLHLSSLPKLEYICEEGFQLDQTLDKLEELYVQGCLSLTELLPSNISVNHLTSIEIVACDMLYSLSSISTFKSLVQLKTLTILHCKTMVEIIRNDRHEGGEGEVEFGQLRSLHLQYLPRLEHFSSTDFAFNFPNLELVNVDQCPSLKIFSKKDSSTPKLQKVQASTYDDGWLWEGNLNATISKMFNERQLSTH